MWTDILGHQKQTEQLKQDIKSSLLPHAYLFSGLGGIGKSLIARTFVKALFCEKAPDVCDKCISCIKIEKNSHPDVFWIEPQTNKILIEQIRELQQGMQFHPLEGNYKAAVINEAQCMTESASNSLLKVLEEPPDKTHFILITSADRLILPTIRSRCRQITFSPLNKKNIVSYLVDKTNTSNDEAKQIAELAQGSLATTSIIDKEFMEGVLDRFENLVDKANASDIIALAEAWSKEEERLPLIFDLIATFYRNMLLARVAKNNATFEEKLYLDETKLRKIMGKRSTDDLLKDFFKVAKARDTLFNTTFSKQLLFEDLLFSLTSVCSM